MTKITLKYSDPDKLARTLIYFPIIHTQVDMGALSESVRRVTLKKLGERGWKRKISMIEKIWTRIDHVIDSFSLPFETVRLYQDGLPVCGREAEIVKELAKAGSRNHQLLLRLMEQGATIMGTESLELLMEEYELVKQILASGEKMQKARIDARQKDLSNSLLKRRDQFIAHRINGTLLNGETGILFLGMLHSLEDLLSRDIQVIYPINRYL